MEAFLKKYDNINVVYCENDNEAFGAMEAIRAAGRTVGSDLAAGDIMILSFDGVSTESMDCVLKDEITCIGECNPLHGPSRSTDPDPGGGQDPGKILLCGRGTVCS